MSEIEYEIQRAQQYLCKMNEKQEEARTAEMIQAVNDQTAINRQKLEAEIQKKLDTDLKESRILKQKKRGKIRRRHSARKWRAVSQCRKIMAAVAAIYGFECLMDSHHVLTLGTMILLMLLALYIFATRIIPEVLWYLRYKEAVAK